MAPSRSLKSAFVDEATIQVHAGRGGNGCHSFYSDKWARYSIPDGGDGGRGGHVLIQANPQHTTLFDFLTQRHFRAGPGTHASSNKKQGATGKNCLIEVPLGTLIYDADTGDLIRELVTVDEQVLVATGGEGGKGNASLRRGDPLQKRKSQVDPEVLRQRVEGRPGQSRSLALELKLLADVGIIGMPNAGKSTLIGRISAAHPKTAAFPFTTRHPVLGAVEGPDEFRFIAVDVPGLIEGASQGRGLGLEFLRHIERTRLLVHIVDMAGTDGRRPQDDWVQLNRELAAYPGGAVDQQQLVVANKMDCDAAVQNLKIFKQKTGITPIRLSAKTGEGVEQLLNRIIKILKSMT